MTDEAPNETPQDSPPPLPAPEPLPTAPDPHLITWEEKSASDDYEKRG